MNCSGRNGLFADESGGALIMFGVPDRNQQAMARSFRADFNDRLTNAHKLCIECERQLAETFGPLST